MTGHRAKKSLGQNFLTDPNLQRRIVAALEPQPHDTIVEIGPGQGALTRHLAASGARLILIELDDALAATLTDEFAGRTDVHVIHGDVLDVDFQQLLPDPHTAKVVGNIPYNITTPIIFRLLERAVRPHSIVLLIQREVADRILAPPGGGEYGALSVGVRSVAAVERLFHVGRGAFRPVPRVDSTVIRITPLMPPPLTSDEEQDLRELTRTLFAWRRKQLQKTLRSAPAYDLDADRIMTLQQRSGIDLQLRPEQLGPEQIVLLARTLRSLRNTTPAAAHES